MPYGLTYQGPTDPEQQGESPDDLVARLLESLEMSPSGAAPTPPSRVGAGRDIMGSLGDALLSMASVRAGGGPVAMGPFAAGQHQTQSDYQERLMEFQKRQTENEAANRTLRNSARMLGARRTPKPYRPQLKSFKTLDPATKRPVEVPYLFDPNSSTLQPMAGHEQGFQQYMRPFLAQGVDKETGEIEFRLLDPFSGAGVGESGGGGGIDTFEPKPSQGESESVESAAVIGDQLGQFKQLAQKYSGRERTLGTVRALGQGIVRELPGGQPVSETFGDTQFEELNALRDRIGQQLARLVESGRLSDQDREFALRNLPSVASLTTDNGRLTAAAKIELVEREIGLRMERKRRLRPGLTGGGTGPASALGSSDYLEPSDLENETETPEQKKAARNAVRRKYGLPEIP